MLQFRYLEDDAFFMCDGKVWKKEGGGFALGENGERIAMPPLTLIEPIDEDFEGEEVESD